MNGRYYTSPQGNDANPGTQAQPWRTLQKAADAVQAGDTVIALSGIYPGERVVVNASGTADSPIRFQAQGTVETPGFLLTGDYLQIDGFTVKVFDCSVSAAFRYGIEARGSHFLIENNRLIETLDAGIYASPNSTRGVIRRNYFYHNVLSAIQLHGKNHLVVENTIRQPLQDHPVCRQRMADDADGIRFFGSGHVLRGNDIRQVWYGAYVRDAHMDCFQTFRGHEDGDPEYTTDILIENNFCEAASYQTEDECGCGITMEMVSSADGTFERGILIRNNVLIAPYASGIHGPASFVSFIHNTCIGSPDFLPYNTFALDYWHPECNHLTIQNNIFYNYTRQFYITKPALETSILSHNLHYRHDGERPRIACHYNTYSEGLPFGKGSLFADPCFANLAAGDFHLLPHSPALEAGIPPEGGLANFDSEGLPRPERGALGAYETRSSSQPNSVSASQALPAAPPVMGLRLSPWVKRIYFADFESTLAGWDVEGVVTLYPTGTKAGGQAVCLRGRAWLRMDTIEVSTAHHEQVVVRALVGIDGLRAGDAFNIFWRACSGARGWRSLHAVRAAGSIANGYLHELILPLPQQANGQPCIQLAFALHAAPECAAYVDNLELLGIPRCRKRHKGLTPFLMG
jgi:hypothetical protein